MSVSRTYPLPVRFDNKPLRKVNTDAWSQRPAVNPFGSRSGRRKKPTHAGQAPSVALPSQRALTAGHPIPSFRPKHDVRTQWPTEGLTRIGLASISIAAVLGFRFMLCLLANSEIDGYFRPLTKCTSPFYSVFQLSSRSRKPVVESDTVWATGTNHSGCGIVLSPASPRERKKRGRHFFFLTRFCGE